MTSSPNSAAVNSGSIRHRALAPLNKDPARTPRGSPTLRNAIFFQA